VHCNDRFDELQKREVKCKSLIWWWPVTTQECLAGQMSVGAVNSWFLPRVSLVRVGGERDEGRLQELPGSPKDLIGSSKADVCVGCNFRLYCLGIKALLGQHCAWCLHAALLGGFKRP